MSTSSLQRYAGRTVLAVGAHPDDVEVGMGGTVARLTELGVDVLIVAVCVPTRFSVRLEEAQRASEILGARFELLRSRGCSRVEDVKTHELVADFDRLLREHQPAAFFAHGPADSHKDHRLVFEAFQAALRVGGLDAFCYQPCTCRPGRVSFAPQAFVDIEATLPTKLAAIEAHHSQFRERGMTADFQRDLARYYGRQAGCTYAEGLEVIHLAL
ncbi:MAG TPA: PIG-L family deacetylase [Polyangiaceae bacterium]|nr:PIG-L family deacetylase [Polyangiaceae bacterium]